MLNSPNDAVYRSNGGLYFTDPPFGLPGPFEDPEKELGFNCVYRLTPKGDVEPLEAGVKAPNGVAFSPDEKTLYVTDVDPDRMAWLAYDVAEDGTLGNRRVFFSAMPWKGARAGAPDGIKVDAAGNLYGAPTWALCSRACRPGTWPGARMDPPCPSRPIRACCGCGSPPRERASDRPSASDENRWHGQDPAKR